MPAALPLATRRKIVQGHQAGKSYAELARDFDLAYGTVRTLCRRVAAEGDDGLRPRYDRCGAKRPQADPLIYRAACWLKRTHPRWGAALIRLNLEARYPERAIPAVRTLQRWFKKAGLQPPRSKPPPKQKRWARRAHEVWQIDAKEQQAIASGQPCCWLTVTDEHTTALLAAPVFSLGAHQSGRRRRGAARPHRHLPTLGPAAGDQG